MFERFTPTARDAVVGAQVHARELRHPAVGPEHLLLGVLDDTGGTAARVLADLGAGPRTVRDALASRDTAEERADAAALAAIGVDLDLVRERAEASFGPAAFAGPSRRRGVLSRLKGSHLPFRPPAKQALVLSLREAVALGHRSIGTEHLLLGLLALDGDPVGPLLVPAGGATVRERLLRTLAAAA